MNTVLSRFDLLSRGLQLEKIGRPWVWQYKLQEQINLHDY